MSRLDNVLAPAAALVLISACGGGGSNDAAAVIGLSAPDQLQVVTVDEGSPLAPPESNPPPVDSDYATDTASRHVFDHSMEPIQRVNSILCYMGQTAADQMVNRGPYNAQIDAALCENGEDTSSSGQGQSSGSNAQQPEMWVVDSVRSDNDSPQFVSVWVPNDEQGQAGEINVLVQIDGGVAADNPFGDFTMNFALIPDGGSLANPLFTGTLETLDSTSAMRGFSFYQAFGDPTQVPPVGQGAELVAVTVEMTNDQATGAALVARSWRFNDPVFGDTGLQSDDFELAFDDVNVLRGHAPDPDACLSRTQFQVNTWGYNLYDAVTGDRIELDSGFPFTTAAGEQGWLGYWGLWTSGAPLANGDVITRHEFGSATTTDYTVVTAPGKLIEHTRHTLDLTAAEGESFEWFDFQAMPPTRFRVEVTGGLFFKVAFWDDVTMAWVTLVTPEQIDTSALGYLGMWSQSLGGQVNYVHGDSYLTYFAEQFVNGASALFAGATTLDFYGYMECLDAELLAVDVEAGLIHLPPQPDVTQPYHFVFDQTDLTLYYDDSGTLRRVGLLDGEVPTMGPYVWGMRSGPMVVDTAGLVTPFDVWSKDVFYTYETGANEWNHYTSAVDAFGDYVVFDPPIQFSYTHTTAADANGDSTWDGDTFFLSYGGPRDLWGIPHTGIDFDGDGNPDRFVPQFSILDGTAMGPTGDEYLIRAIDSELTLMDDPSGCLTLDLASAQALTLPDGSNYVAPDIGIKPVVTDPPAVIFGKVQ